MKQFPFSLQFHGGSDEVTGSRHLLTVADNRILLDCGLFQGHRREAIEKNRTFSIPPRDMDAVLLSHAHIDHSGGLPLLVKLGFQGPIHCTQATADLIRIMLMDSARLQEEDAKYFNKIHQSDGEMIEPLYTVEDAEHVFRLLVPHKYEKSFDLFEGVSVTFLNAGHVLGSAMIRLEIDTPTGKRRILFTGDLGRQKTILIEPPVIPKNIDYLLIESTYGDRLHDVLGDVGTIFASVIERALREKGKILIPSFALERTQEVIIILEKLIRDKRVPPIHLYVDSPLATAITQVFQKYMPNLKDEFEGFGSVRYTQSVDESKALNNIAGPHIILSGSGMCEGGRILHHLRNNIDNEKTTVLLVGYQAQGTLGRRLAEGAKRVKIFGLEHQVLLRVQMLHHFSAHADKNDLLWFMKGLAPRPRSIFLVHGDPESRAGLTAALKENGIDRVVSPRFGDVFPLE